ncbi:MAG: hypothetical protein P8170_20690, partial [Gemmatimonadota bacterium]
MTNPPNPLLADVFRIPFHRIRAEHVVPGVRDALAGAQAEVDALAGDTATPTWDNTLERLDRTLELLSRRIAPASHLMSVRESPELRDA